MHLISSSLQWAPWDHVVQVDAPDLQDLRVCKDQEERTVTLVLQAHQVLVDPLAPQETMDLRVTVEEMANLDLLDRLDNVVLPDHLVGLEWLV